MFPDIHFDEFAHGALLHHARGFYAQAKERRKNELLGGIAAGLNGLAAGMEAYNAAAYGIPTSGTDYGAAIANIGNDIKISTLKYSFKYSREQEWRDRSMLGQHGRHKTVPKSAF